MQSAAGCVGEANGGGRQSCDARWEKFGVLVVEGLQTDTAKSRPFSPSKKPTTRNLIIIIISQCGSPPGSKPPNLAPTFPLVIKEPIHDAPLNIWQTKEGGKRSVRICICECGNAFAPPTTTLHPKPQTSLLLLCGVSFFLFPPSISPFFCCCCS